MEDSALTRSSAIFVVSLVAVTSGLTALTWAQGQPDNFTRFWGRQHTYPPSPGLSGARRQPPATVSDRVHHWNGSRSTRAGSITRRSLPARPQSSASSSARDAQPRDGDRAHRDLRRGERDRRRLPRATPAFADAPPRRVDGRGDRAGGARHARRAVSVAGAALRQRARRGSRAAIPRRPDARSDGIALGRRAAAAILAQRAKRRLATHAEPLLGIDYSPATRRATGARIRSASSARARRALGRGDAVRALVRRAVSRAAAAGA